MSNTFRYRLNDGPWIEQTGVPFTISSAATDRVDVEAIGTRISSEPMAEAVTATASVVAVVGQSENVTGFLDNNSYWTGGPMPGVLDGVDMQLTIPGEYAEGQSDPLVVSVTQDNANAQNVSPGAVGIANLWHIGSGGRPLRLAGVCRSGTGMLNMMDDDSSVRDFDTDAETVAAAEAAWGPIERVMYQWYGSESPATKTLWESRSAHFFGLNPDGTDYDFASETLEHCLIDKRANKVGGNVGLLRDTVKVDVMYPGTFTPTPAWQDNIDPPYINYRTDANGVSIGSRAEQNAAPAYQERRDFLVDAPTENTGLATVSPALAVMGDYENGVQKPGFAEVGAHPGLQTKYGQILYSQDVAFGLLCAHGFARPTTLNRVEQEENGAYVDFIFDLPPGAVLSTHRIVDGLTVADPRPHQQQVMGFVIRRSGDTDRTERPVYRTDLATSGSALTNYPLAYRGTVTIHDAAGGVVRVTPEEPFENADSVTFGGDGTYGTFSIHGAADYDAQLCLDGLRAYEERLDDGTVYRYPGGAVVAQETHRVAGLAGAGNPMPVAGTVTRATGDNPSLRGPNVPANTNTLTFVFEGEIGVQPGFGAPGIFLLDNNALRLDADTRASERRTRIQMANSSGSALFSVQSFGRNSLAPAGQTMRIMLTATQNDGTGNYRVRYYFNDSLMGSEVTGPTTGDGTFRRFPLIVLPSNVETSPGRVMIWAGDYADVFSTDGILPSVAPLVTLQGNADFWNGTGLPDGWSTAGSGSWSNK